MNYRFSLSIIRSLLFFFLTALLIPISAAAQQAVVLYQSDKIELGKRLETAVPVLPEQFWTKPDQETSPDIVSPVLTIHVRVINPRCGWTIVGARSVYLTNGKKQIFPEPIVRPDSSNFGRLPSGQELAFRFPCSPADLSVSDLSVTRNQNNEQSSAWTLVLESGIFSWESPQGSFSLEIYAGEKLFAVSETDPLNRMVHVSVTAPEGYQRFQWTLPNGTTIETDAPQFRHRFIALSKSRKPNDRNSNETESATLKLKAFRDAADSPCLTLDIPVWGNKKAQPPLNEGEKLVGLCFYPAVPDSARQKQNKEKPSNESETGADPDQTTGQAEWEAPRLPCDRYCSEYVNDFLKERLGNLAVFWPNAPGPTADQADATESIVRKLASEGVYSMTIYQRQSLSNIQKLSQAGKQKFFLYNNLGEYASYLYQGRESAQACNIPTDDNLIRCQNHFIYNYMRGGAKTYHQSCPFIFSTSGSTLSNYELAGGVDFVCSELFAIGAQNLAWAGSEMRGAARKWQPELWGSWLAHEWQTCDIPYQSPLKMKLLRAALYQQYLMGSSIFVLESGSQTTQAGFYTADSGKRNFGHNDPVVKQYQKEMRQFYEFVKRSPSFSGGPQTDIAVATGNGDSYCGLYLENAPVWGQHETAARDVRWKYGAPERTQELVQNLFFPRPKGALEPYPNRFLAGNPFGQTDIVGLDNYTVLTDVNRYRLLIFGGWNSMTPPIADLLTQYVKQGGTVFLSVPHLSTRTDRESVQYQPSDLWNAGNLSPLIDVKITGKRPVSGTVQSSWLSESKSGGLANRPASDSSRIAGTFAVFQDQQHASESSVKDETEAPIEVLASQGTAPLLIRQQREQGFVYLFLGWEYPGQSNSSRLFKAIISRLALDFSGPNSGRPWLEADADALPCISWSVYNHGLYLLNLDCSRSRKCTVCFPNGRKQDFVLPSAEIVLIPFTTPLSHSKPK